MDCQALPIRNPSLFVRVERLLLRMVEAVTWRRSMASPQLDLEVMSDHLKRDLGFLDGREPRQDGDLSR